MGKNLPVKRNPLFQGNMGLNFDNLESPEDLIELTPQQKADKFMSKYLDVFQPFTRFKEYFDGSAKTGSHILRDVKLYYSKLVIDGKWTEKKYVACVNDIFANKMVFSVVTLDAAGLRFDKGLLASQQDSSSGGRKRL